MHGRTVWQKAHSALGGVPAVLIAALLVAGVAALVGAVLMRLSGPFVSVATLGFFVSLIVIGGCRSAMEEATFKDWGWRIPFLISLILLAVSVYIRLMLNESPAGG